MKLVVGLGNPGKEHVNNRHNVGFMLVDYVVKAMNLNDGFIFQKKFDAEILEIKDRDKILFAKPQTYMNGVGESVKKIADFYKIHTDDIFVVHDDLDIRLGEYKMQKNKGPKVHNGILSLENHLGTTDFNRIRIGIDNRNENDRIAGKDYVLQNFSKDEEKKLKEVLHKIIADSFHTIIV